MSVIRGRLRLNGSAIGLIAVVALACALPLMFLLWQDLPEISKYKRLMESGVGGTAMVTGHYERSTKSSSIHYIIYSYTVGAPEPSFHKRIPRSFACQSRHAKKT